MARRSRYENCRPFQSEPVEPRAFKGIRPRIVGVAPGVLEHEVKEWDRADLLALHYYNDCDLWWRILDANPDILCAIDLLDDIHTGTTILVPKTRD
jgi:hypothetical protein